MSTLVDYFLELSVSLCLLYFLVAFAQFQSQELELQPCLFAYRRYPASLWPVMTIDDIQEGQVILVYPALLLFQTRLIDRSVHFFALI